jgi:hypothetical protein
MGLNIKCLKFIIHKKINNITWYLITFSYSRLLHSFFPFLVFIKGLSRPIGGNLPAYLLS